jgi:UDP-N-acetylmuramoyl-tripeptide--D-alanyl-D-alanine ligase
MNIQELYSIFIQYPIISTDSRQIIKGSLFFALKGDNFDGNKFAIDALNKGAAYSVVDNPEFSKNDKCILVDDVLATMQNLATYHRKQLKIPVIGITGTNGKTTTKELLNAVLSTKYKTVSTLGNLNNHIGVPLTLLSIPFDCEMAIIEMGANHIGEIEGLCNIAMPTYGIITNIGKAHLEGFGSFEGVVKAKTELYNYIDTNNGIIFYNNDNDLLLEHANKLRCKTITYGNNNNASLRGSVVSSDPYLKCIVNFEPKNPINIDTAMFGAYNFENVMAASAIGAYFNVPYNLISSAIMNYQPSNNRSQLKFEKTNVLLCDYYNANPSSMEVAIKNFSNSNIDNKAKVLILGAMKELGENSKYEHEKLIKMLEFYNFNEVYLVGNEFTSCNIKKFKHFNDSVSMSNYLTMNKLTNRYVLIKGSRAARLEKVVDALNC